MSEKSFGEQLIRTEFNPSNDSTVQHIKERFAELANYINENIQGPGRLKSIAITSLEEAAMWAVKAATE